MFLIHFLTQCTGAQHAEFEVSTIAESRMSAGSTVTIASHYSEKNVELASFDDVDIETGVSKRVVESTPAVWKINPSVYSYVSLSWMTNLMFLGNKKPLNKDVRILACYV